GQEIHGAEVLAPEGLAARLDRRDAPRPYILIAVGTPGARAEIRAALEARGATEPSDYRTVA
ncbi:MAG: glycosyl transferase family 2, partial [Gemmatimonadota bacterium]